MFHLGKWHCNLPAAWCTVKKSRGLRCPTNRTKGSYCSGTSSCWDGAKRPFVAVVVVEVFVEFDRVFPTLQPYLMVFRYIFDGPDAMHALPSRTVNALTKTWLPMSIDVGLTVFFCGSALHCMTDTRGILLSSIENPSRSKISRLQLLRKPSACVRATLLYFTFKCNKAKTPK